MNALLLADTPNLFRTVVRCHGTDAIPDYGAILNLGRELGEVSAYAFVNPGVSPRFAEAVRNKGFKVIGSKAEDVDDSLVANAVRLGVGVDWVVLCSGDGDYIPLARLLQSTGVKVGVIAEPMRCSQELRRVADCFFPAPFFVIRGAMRSVAVAA